MPAWLRLVLNNVCLVVMLSLGVAFSMDYGAMAVEDAGVRARIDAVKKRDAELAQAWTTAEKLKSIARDDPLAQEEHKKLLPKIDAVPDTDLPGHVTFATLESMPRTIAKQGGGEIPPALKALDGKRVTITGCLLVAFAVEPITEIIIAKNPWDECCLGTAPTLWDSLTVTMKKGDVLQKSRIRVATIEGVLHVKPKYNQEGLLETLYTMDDAKETELVGSIEYVSQRMWYMTLMPIVLAIWAAVNIIGSPKSKPATDELVFSDRKFSIKD